MLDMCRKLLDKKRLKTYNEIMKNIPIGEMDRHKKQTLIHLCASGSLHITMMSYRPWKVMT